MSGINFDARGVAPVVGFPVAPAGTYYGCLTKCDLEPTERGDAEKIVCVFTVQGGVYNGKDINFNINWRNPSAAAERIGHGQFSAICHATGVLVPQDTTQLLHKPFNLEVEVSPDKKWNQLVAITAIAGSAPVQQNLPPPMQAAPAPVTQQAPPPPIVMAAPPAPVATFPPAGWLQHPQNPAYYYEASNPSNIRDENTLRALMAAVPGATSVVAIPPPVMQAPPMVAGGAPATPDWIANQVGNG